MHMVYRHSLCTLLTLAGLTGGVSAVAWAQQGTLAGRVTDQANGQPLAGARVVLVGTSLIAGTNADGRFTVPGVPEGRATVRASAVGYAAATRVVTVTAGETAAVDLALALAPYSLDEVVVTSTTEEAKRQVGSSIARIDAAKLVETAPITNVTDLLIAKAAGVDVLPGTLTGSPSRVRIRGTNSLSLNNEPVYFLDGIRVTSQNRSSGVCNVGCAAPSRINDLNPEDFESIDVVKGPAASALYGTDAANGVVLITTKHGAPGKARWNLYAEQGMIKDYNDYPAAFRGWRTGTTAATTSTPANTVQCILTQVAAGTCVQDSVTQFNLFQDPKTTPLGTGHRQQYGVQVSGGSDAVRYYMSGEWEDEVGQTKMPLFADSILRALRQISELPGDQAHPNALRRTSVRANLSTNPNARMDLQASTVFISSKLRVLPTDNNTTGLLSNALGGPGNETNGRFGYRLFTPNEMFSEAIGQDINRFIGSTTGRWRPTSWLSFRAIGGIDYASRLDTDLCKRDDCVNFATIKTGFKQDDRTAFFQYTGDFNGTASFTLSPTLTSRTTVGAQYFKTKNDLSVVFAENLAGGATTVTGGGIPDVRESTTVSSTVGVLAEQQFGYKDRLFLNVGLGIDDTTALGAVCKQIYYPKVSVSYVI